MPHVAHHGKDAVYGQQKTFAPLGLSKDTVSDVKRIIENLRNNSPDKAAGA